MNITSFVRIEEYRGKRLSMLTAQSSGNGAGQAVARCKDSVCLVARSMTLTPLTLSILTPLTLSINDSDPIDSNPH